MRSFTNLAWPETPFGANQRPFGRRRSILTAFAAEWTKSPSGPPLPITIAIVYLYTPKRGVLDITEESLRIGFRSHAIDDDSEVFNLISDVDAALLQARWQAVAVAGARLGDELTKIRRLAAGRRLRGVDDLAHLWKDRSTKARGIPTLVDTKLDIAEETVTSEMWLDPLPMELSPEASLIEAAAATCLVRALGHGLIAARHLQKYRWEGAFQVIRAMHRTAWDLIDDVNWEKLAAHVAGHPAVAEAQPAAIRRSHFAFAP